MQVLVRDVPRLIQVLAYPMCEVKVSSGAKMVNTLDAEVTRKAWVEVNARVEVNAGAKMVMTRVPLRLDAVF